MNKLEQLIFELDELKQTNKEQQDKFQIKKKYLEKKIDQLLEKKNEVSYSFSDSGIFYKATSVKLKSIEWKINTLQQVLDKEIFNEICNKTYTIIDYDGMAKYLKSIGADPKKIKSFISCEKKIDQKKVDQLSELGEISLDDLEGCYSVQNKESYIKITKTEEEIDEE